MKSSAAQPLFPVVGTHWSVYGASLALDSLVRYMGAKKGLSLRKYKHTSGPREKPYKWLDTDLRDISDLLFDFDADSVSYPVYTFDSADTTGYFRPRIMVITDSYFTAMQYSTDLNQLFDNSSTIWNHDSQEFDPLNGVPRGGAKRPVNPTEIEHCDFLIIMNTEKNYDKFDFGIMDSYYATRRK